MTIEIPDENVEEILHDLKHTLIILCKYEDLTGLSTASEGMTLSDVIRKIQNK